MRRLEMHMKQLCFYYMTSSESQCQRANTPVYHLSTAVEYPQHHHHTPSVRVSNQTRLTAVPPELAQSNSHIIVILQQYVYKYDISYLCSSG